MESKNRPEIIRYFKECYQSDSGELVIRDVMSKSIISYILTREERGRLYHPDGFHVFYTHGERFKAQLDAYKREKKLLVGIGNLIFKSTTVLMGQTKTYTICSPLLFHEASLIAENDGYTLHFDPYEIQWNTPILQSLVSDKEALAEWEDRFQGKSSSDLDWLAFEEWLVKNNSEIDIEQLDPPKGSVELKEHKRRARKKTIKIAPGALLFIAERSASTRGVVHELEQLEKRQVLSKPLQQLFHLDQFSAAPNIKNIENRVPGLMSPAQHKILENAGSQVLSQVIGPPGTGKSYTIGSIALEQFLRKKSILIVAQTESAIDVIQHKLINDLGLSTESVVRCGKHYRFNEMKQYIDRLTRWSVPHWNKDDVSSELKSVNKEIAQLKKTFTKNSISEVSDGIRLERIYGFGGPMRWADRFWLWIKRLFRTPSQKLYEQIDRIHELQLKRQELLLDQIDHFYYRSLVNTLRNKRKDLINFRMSLSASKSSVQDQRLKNTNFHVILNTLPIWLCTLDTLHKALPLYKEQFDLVIFDEATQCNIASCLPALYRAKSAVVVGDPKQLRHVSFLSSEDQTAIRKKLKIDPNTTPFTLDYRNHSIIDLANQGIHNYEAVVMLDEHFRSLPEIISFSNQKFYEGQLRIMTEKPVPHSHYPLREIKCQGLRKRNINEKEADEILAKVKSIVESQKELPKGSRLSIGLLSFFREQSDYLQSRLFDAFDYETLDAHQLRSGTPYSFQGEERDIMLISCCVDDASVKKVLGYLNREDVFNVAVTRAKGLQLLYTSFDYEQINESSLIHEYLKSIHSAEIKSVENELILRGKYLQDLVVKLQQNQVEVLENYTVAGMALDLVAIHRQKLLAIDLIGFPGEYENPFSLDRIHVLSRIALPVFPVSLYEWLHHPDEIIQAICKRLAIDEPLKEEDEQLVIENGHWHRLIPIDHQLATRMRTLELDFSARDDERGLHQIDSLLTAYEQFLETLDAKLNPSEMTYKRYKSAVDHLLTATINNFAQINILQHSLPEDQESMSPEIQTLFQKQLDLIKDLYNHNDKAVEQFQKMAMLWSSVDLTGNLPNRKKR
ncbi:DNA2/NAM7 family helicase [bacterium SCSIO 12741]|nr:DNA2/NAM7 family helicase [bacterium SCSIO 12741]